MTSARNQNNHCCSVVTIPNVSTSSSSTSLIKNTATVAGRKVTNVVTNRHERKWMQRFEQLVEYSKKHGHCNPNSLENNDSDNDAAALAMWTKNQRMSYKYDKEGVRPMPQQRKDLLNSIGFQWSIQDSKWMQMYAELVQFHEIHGHAHVPMVVALATPGHDNYQNNNNNNIRKETMSWRRSNQQHHWQPQEQESHHDSTSPLWMRSDKLARWVAQQRLRYKRTMDVTYATTSKSLPLSREQVELLEKLEFAWHPRDDVWWKRFHELEEFVSIHGHCHVPQRYAENQELGTWCHHQRRSCKEYVLSCMIEQRVQGVYVSGLNEERLQALRSIQFCWFPEESVIQPPEGVLDSWYVTTM